MLHHIQGVCGVPFRRLDQRTRVNDARCRPGSEQRVQHGRVLRAQARMIPRHRLLRDHAVRLEHRVRVFGPNQISTDLTAIIAYLPLVSMAILMVAASAVIIALGVVAALGQLHIATNVVDAVLYAGLAACRYRDRGGRRRRDHPDAGPLGEKPGQLRRGRSADGKGLAERPKRPATGPAGQGPGPGPRQLPGCDPSLIRSRLGGGALAASRARPARPGGPPGRQGTRGAAARGETSWQ